MALQKCVFTMSGDFFSLLRYRLGGWPSSGAGALEKIFTCSAQNQRAAKAQLRSKTAAHCTTLHCAPQPFSSSANPSPQPVFLHSLVRDGPFLLLNCKVCLTLQSQPCTFLAEETIFLYPTLECFYCL